MELYNVIVKGQEIRLDGSPRDMAVPSVGYAFCHFEFHGDEWSEGIKKGIFVNGRSERPYEQLLDINGVCEIPHEVLQHTGVVLAGVVTRDANGEVLNLLIPSYQCILGRVTEVPIVGGNSIPPTPAEWEQYIIPYGSPLAEAETLAAGTDATAEVSIEGGHTTFSFGIPKGKDGEDGFSPSASVSKVGNKSTITIIDAEGTTSAEVEDGYSPSASVNKVGKVATILITDKDGTTAAMISDGNDGYSPSASVVKSSNKSTITITDKDGTTVAEVVDGTDGNGIASTVLNDDYTLTINFTDGTSYTTPSIRGPQGEVTTEQMNTAITLAVSVKVDKVPGKGLSTNDFTNANRAFVDNFTIVNDEICMEV